MSLENRKRVYDNLVALGDDHYHRLSEPLKKEFGDPRAKPEPPKPKKAAPKKEEPKKEEKTENGS
jgi:hypothetical protein|tara:strand:+ start:3241 stop:3435 length:195 start_codon:yes stop_codon:yes gene_type:complete